MTDKELIEGFESCSLTDFHHRDHVRVVWLYLHRKSLLSVLTHFAEALRRFAKSKGKPNLYHETITWAYILLIHDRIVRSGDPCWDDFADRNQDLLDWKDNVLKLYYSSEVLDSELARQVFVFPDRPGNETDRLA